MNSVGIIKVSFSYPGSDAGLIEIAHPLLEPISIRYLAHRPPGKRFLHLSSR
jgi:hypothetical protein